MSQQLRGVSIELPSHRKVEVDGSLKSWKSRRTEGWTSRQPCYLPLSYGSTTKRLVPSRLVGVFPVVLETEPKKEVPAD